MSTVDWAVSYLRRGWAVIPVGGDKKPLISSWKQYQQALPTEYEVRDWYTQRPNAGVAILTGRISNLVVLDVDPRNGGDASLVSFLAESGLTEADLLGPKVSTQSGGAHYYFKYPENQVVKTRAGFRPGLDLKSDGGYCVAPPSTVPGTDRGWTWAQPDGEPPPLLPALVIIGDPAWRQPAPGRATEAGPRQLQQREYGGLLQPKSAGERMMAMVRLVGHFCALGETQIATYRIMSMWNEKNTPPLEPDEFDYQFGQMFSRWGAPREEISFEEEVRSVENLDEEMQREALIHILGGKRMGAQDYEMWKERLKRDYGLPMGTFKALVKRSTDNEAEDHSQDPVPVEGEDRVVAIEMLKDPSIAHRVLMAFKTDGLVGEEANAMLLYLACTSRLTDDPINTISLGSAASGKSLVMLLVLKFIPPEEKIVRQRWSAQAIIYTKLSFKHKVLCILERAGAEAAGYNLRTIQSEKIVSIEVTSKDPSSGEMATTVHPKEGPAAFLTTTTDPDIDDQDESRVWILHPDETRDQTFRIMRSQESEWKISEEELQVFINAQRLLNVMPVARPSKLIRAVSTLIQQNLPDVPVRMRRDHNRLIAAIQASALLHQYQRDVNEEGQLVPDLRDYYVVWKIASVAFQQSIRGKLDPKVQEVAAALRAIYIETADAVRPEQVAAVLGLQQVTIYKWLKKGMEAGVIQREEKGKYVPVGVTPNGDSLQVLPTPNEVVELDPSLGVGIELVDPITGQTMVSDR